MTSPNEPASETPTRPLLGTWRFNNGYLCCGTLRVAVESFDTNPSESFKSELMAWVCYCLNSGEPAALRRDLAAARAEVAEMRGILSREVLLEDDYGVHGSTFYVCPFCEEESGAGVLNKGIAHAAGCILNGDSNICESVMALTVERDSLRAELSARDEEISTARKDLAEAVALIERLAKWSLSEETTDEEACRAGDCECCGLQRDTKALLERLKPLATKG
jgi:hypothetical protein